MKKVVLLVFLAASAALGNQFALRKVEAVSNPIIFTMRADFNGWNFTTAVNPALTEFRGVQFTANIQWVNSVHDFAIYTNGFPASSVSTSNVCSLTNTNGCLKVSPFVSSTNPSATLTFNSTIPLNDFTGPGTYQYFCQIHPSAMHGIITFYKSPDILKRGTVDIVDAAALAFSFDTTPLNATWNAATDLDNNGKVTILDAALLAFYFDQPF